MKSRQAGLASCVYTILFTGKTATISCLYFVSRCVVTSPVEIYCTYVAVHLSEVDVLCGREVEALLVALVLQETLCEPICYFHIAAVELLCVQRGVGQNGSRLLDLSRVQERRVTVKLVRLEKEKKNTSI